MASARMRLRSRVLSSMRCDRIIPTRERIFMTFLPVSALVTRTGA